MQGITSMNYKVGGFIFSFVILTSHSFLFSAQKPLPPQKPRITKAMHDAFYNAVRTGNVDGIKQGFADGYSLNCVDSLGCSTLMYAAAKGYTEVISYLCTLKDQFGCLLVNYNMINSFDYTALGYAKLCKQADCQRLLEAAIQQDKQRQLLLLGTEEEKQYKLLLVDEESKFQCLFQLKEEVENNFPELLELKVENKSKCGSLRDGERREFAVLLKIVNSSSRFTTPCSPVRSNESF